MRVSPWPSAALGVSYVYGYYFGLIDLEVHMQVELSTYLPAGPGLEASRRAGLTPWYLSK